MARSLLDLGKKLKDYFTPSANAGQNFWSSPAARGLANFQLQNPIAPVFSGEAARNIQLQAKNLINPPQQFTQQHPYLSGAGLALGSYAQPVVGGFGALHENRPLIEKAGGFAGTVGAATAPVSTMIGGGVGVGFNALGNIVARRPALQGSREAFAQGVDFSAKIAGIGKFLSPAIKPLLNKLNPTAVNNAYRYVQTAKVAGIPTAQITKVLMQNIFAAGVEGGTGAGVLGLTEPAKDIKQRLAQGAKQAGAGFAFGVAIKGVTYGGQGAIGSGKAFIKGLKNQPGFVDFGALTPQQKSGYQQLIKDRNELAKIYFEASKDQPGVVKAADWLMKKTSATGEGLDFGGGEPVKKQVLGEIENQMKQIDDQIRSYGVEPSSGRLLSTTGGLQGEDKLRSLTQPTTRVSKAGFITTDGSLLSAPGGSHEKIASAVMGKGTSGDAAHAMSDQLGTARVFIAPDRVYLDYVKPLTTDQLRSVVKLAQGREVIFDQSAFNSQSGNYEPIDSQVSKSVKDFLANYQGAEAKQLAQQPEGIFKDLITQGKLNEARNLANGLPDTDPLKESMLSILARASKGQKVGMGVRGEDVALATEGWKPGLKQRFDDALFRKDVAQVKNLLPDVPEYYRSKFASEIFNLIGTPKGKQPGFFDIKGFKQPEGTAANAKDVVNALETGNITTREARLYGLSNQAVAPYIKDPIEKITNALEGASSLQGQQQNLYSAERSRRVGAVAGIEKRIQEGKISPEQGYYQQLGKLKGELPKVQFESIKDQITQKDINSVFKQIGASNLSPYEQITAKNALGKLWGEQGGSLPTESEISLLNEVFPQDFVQAILDKRTLTQQLFSGGKNVLNLPRAMMATGDLSAPLRQGVFLVGRPKQWIPAFKEMFRDFAKEENYQASMDEIKSRDTYPVMREAGLSLTDTGTNLTTREEAFMTNYSEKIPIFGHLSRASNRAYSGFLNKLRADTFDSLLKSAQETGATNVEAGGNWTNPKVLENIGGFVNAATGRGNLPQFLKESAPVLNSMFFSPRLMASRLTLLNPLYYVKLDPFTRKEALKSLFSFGVTAGAVMGLAKLGGADVGTDARSADFGKIKVGNTRFDILGGFQQYLVLLDRLFTGQMVSSTTGREFALNGGYGGTSRATILSRAVESKMAPVFSFLLSLTQGKTSVGEDFRLGPEIIDRFIPMAWQDMYDLYREKGNPLAALGATPALFGVGVQTYGDQIPIYTKTATGRPSVQFRQSPSLGETIYNKFTGTELTNVPKEQQGPLIEAKKTETLKKIDLDRVKARVLETGQPETFGDTQVYLKNGVVTTKKIGGAAKTPTINNLLKQFQITPQNVPGPPGSSLSVPSARAAGESLTQPATGIYDFYDTKGKYQYIDLSQPLSVPQSTGSYQLDKQVMSDFKSSITKRSNDIVTLWENGKIDQNQAESMLAELDKLKDYTNGPKKITIKAGKKGRTIKAKAFKSSFKASSYKVPKITGVKLTKPKATKLTMAKLPAIKFKTPAKPKISLRNPTSLTGLG